MKSLIAASLLAIGVAQAGEVRNFKCNVDDRYPVLQNLGTISLQVIVSPKQNGSSMIESIDAVTSMSIQGKKQVIRPGSTSANYIYAMDGYIRKLAFEISYSESTDLSYKTAMRLYAYGKSPWSQHADPIPENDIAIYTCKRAR